MPAGRRECHRREGHPWEAVGAAHVSFPLAETTLCSAYSQRSRPPIADPEPGTGGRYRPSRVLPASLPDRAHARFAVADYIKVFYNRQRLHCTLGYRTSRRGTHRLPGRSNRCLINYPRSCPRSLRWLSGDLWGVHQNRRSPASGLHMPVLS